MSNMFACLLNSAYGGEAQIMSLSAIAVDVVVKVVFSIPHNHYDWIVHLFAVRKFN